MADVKKSCCAWKHRRKWAGLTLFACLLLLGAAIYLYIAIKPLVLRLTCVLDKMASLISVAGSVGSGVITQLPPDIISAMRAAVPYLDFASMGPAIIGMILFLLSGACGCRSSKTYCCSKLFIILADIFLVMVFAFYLAIGIAGLLYDKPVFTDQYKIVTDVCIQSLPTLQKALGDAEAAQAAAAANGASPGQLASAQSQLGAAQNQMADFTEMCSCLDELPSELGALTGAGLTGAAAVVLAYIFVNGLCCATGCCRQPKVAPEEDEEEYYEEEEGHDKEGGGEEGDGEEGDGEEEEEFDEDGDASRPQSKK